MPTNDSNKAKRKTTTTTTTKRVRRATTTASAQPGDEQIRLRAYEIFLRRHGASGDPFEDWLLAERELMAEAASVKSVPRRASRAADFG